MSYYSIKELESLSDIKSHTIRIWEKRYDLLTPSRTDTNIRVYDDSQLKKLLNVALLINQGRKISKVAVLSDEEIDELINEEINRAGETGKAHYDNAIKDIIVAGLTYDEALFEKVFQENITSLGVTKMLLKIIYPALVKIGIMWQGSQMFPAQEHMISYMIKRKLFVAIDEEKKIKPNGRSTGNKWLLFLPNEETHETGLLFSHLLLLQKGSEVLYLGERVPISNLPEINREVRPNKILYFLNTGSRNSSMQKIVDEIGNIFEGKEIYLAGTHAILENLDLKGQKWLKSPHDLMEMPG